MKEHEENMSKEDYEQQERYRKQEERSITIREIEGTIYNLIQLHRKAGHDTSALYVAVNNQRKQLLYDMQEGI